MKQLGGFQQDLSKLVFVQDPINSNLYKSTQLGKLSSIIIPIFAVIIIITAVALLSIPLLNGEYNIRYIGGVTFFTALIIYFLFKHYRNTLEIDILNKTLSQKNAISTSRSIPLDEIKGHEVITKTINGGFSGSDIYVTTTKNYKYKIFQQVVYQDHLDTYLDNFYHILHLAGRKQQTQTIKNENNIFPDQSQRLARGKLINNILTVNFLSDSRYFQILQSIFFVITFFGIGYIIQRLVNGGAYEAYESLIEKSNSDIGWSIFGILFGLVMLYMFVFKNRFDICKTVTIDGSKQTVVYSIFGYVYKTLSFDNLSHITYTQKSHNGIYHGTDIQLKEQSGKSHLICQVFTSYQEESMVNTIKQLIWG